MCAASHLSVIVIFTAITCQSDSRILPRAALETAYVNNVGIDSYEFEFQTPDGITRKEKGFFSNGVWTVVGEYSWISDDGKLYSYRYSADDNGYKQSEVPGVPAATLPPPTRPPATTIKPVVPVAVGISCGTQAALLGCGK